MSRPTLPLDFNRRPASALNRKMRAEVHNVEVELPPGEGLDFHVPVKKGFLSYLKGMLVKIQPPEGATDGQHVIAVYYESNNQGTTPLVIVEGHFHYNQQAYINAGAVLGANIRSRVPDDYAAMATQLNNVTFDENVQLGVYYFNGTDVTQTALLERKFIILDEQVVND